MPGLGYGRQAFIESTGTENKLCWQWAHKTTLHTERKCSLAAKRGRRRKQLLDDFNEMRGHLKLKEEALDRALWRTGFGKGYGSVVIETREWNYFWQNKDRRRGLRNTASCTYPNSLSYGSTNDAVFEDTLILLRIIRYYIILFVRYKGFHGQKRLMMSPTCGSCAFILIYLQDSQNGKAVRDTKLHLRIPLQTW